MGIDLEKMRHGGICWEEVMGHRQRPGSGCGPGGRDGGRISNINIQCMKSPQRTMCGKEACQETKRRPYK